MNTTNLIAQQDSLAINKIDEVVLSATKYPTAIKNIGKIVYQITAKDLQENPQKTVSQVLNEVSGFELNGSNNALGKNITIYVRGGKASQVLVIIDGIAMSDPSGINLSYDLNQLTLSQIESIEILKGASSTLYGTGAATAVIVIQTKKSSDKVINVRIGGSLMTYRTSDDDFISGNHFIKNVMLDGTYKRLSYFASYSGTQAEGISETTAFSSEFNTTDDPFHKNSFLGKLGYKISDKINMQFVSSFINTSHDFDGGAYTDVESNLAETNEFRLGLQAAFTYDKGDLKVFVNHKKAEREYDQYNAFINVQENYLYKSNSLIFDAYNLYKFSDKINLITGVDIQNHNTDITTPYGDIDKDTGNFSLIDPYVNINLNPVKGLNLNTGVRLNWHNVYGTHTTFNINPSYNISINKSNNLKLLTSYSSAYIVPSIYQLFSNYGNENLTPEKTKTFEGGLEYSLSNKLKISALYFDRVEENAIIFVTDFETYVSNYDNETEGNIFVNGVEVEFNHTPIKSLLLKSNYTHTLASEVRTFSIPKNKWNSMIRYSFPSKTSLSINHQYSSDRTQLVYIGWESSIESLDSYHLFDLTVSQKLIKDKLFLAVGVRNIFDKEFIETIGYSSKGRNLSLSFNYKF